MHTYLLASTEWQASLHSARLCPVSRSESDIVYGLEEASLSKVHYVWYNH